MSDSRREFGKQKKDEFLAWYQVAMPLQQFRYEKWWFQRGVLGMIACGRGVMGVMHNREGLGSARITGVVRCLRSCAWPVQ